MSEGAELTMIYSQCVGQYNSDEAAWGRDFLVRVTLVLCPADSVPGWPGAAVRRAGAGAGGGQCLAGVLQASAMAHEEQT